MIFGNMAAFWLLLVIVLVLILGLWGWRAKRAMAKIWLDEKSAKISQTKKYILAVILITIVIFAIAVPKIPFALSVNAEKEGLIVFMFDVSGSMAAKKDLDFLSRVEREKLLSQKIIDEFPGATFYPFHFTSIARSFTPPLTREDFFYLKRSIERIVEVYSAPGENSDFGRSILQVIDKISKEKKAKIIVLFSDGEFFLPSLWGGNLENPDLYPVMRKAIQENIKIITVGVGEKEGSTIPLYNQEGEFAGEFAKRYDGEVFVTRLEEETLKLIASETQGEYFSEKDFKGIADFLSKNMENSADSQRDGYQDISYWLLVPIAILWIIFARFYLK